MDRGPDADLPAGEYWITPALDASEVSLWTLLFGDLGYETEADGERVHKYEVVGADGSHVFDVLETHGSTDSEWLPVSLPQYCYVFADREREPHLVVAVDQGTTGYTLRDPRTEVESGTVTKSGLLSGDWELQDAEGEALATADKVDESSPLLSKATYVTWEVTGPEGASIAEFQRGPAEGSSSDRLSAINVSCSRSTVPTELLLSFAFALLHRGSQSTIRSERGP